MAKRRLSGEGLIRLKKKGQWEGRIVVGHKKNGDAIFRYHDIYRIQRILTLLCVHIAFESQMGYQF